MTTDTLFDITGWIGAVAVLLAYALVSTRRWDGGSVGYQLMNLAGGVCLGANTAYNGAYPSTVVNVVWVGIALAAIAHVARVSLEKSASPRRHQRARLRTARQSRACRS